MGLKFLEDEAANAAGYWTPQPEPRSWADEAVIKKPASSVANYVADNLSGGPAIRKMAWAAKNLPNPVYPFLNPSTRKEIGNLQTPPEYAPFEERNYSTRDIVASAPVQAAYGAVRPLIDAPRVAAGHAYNFVRSLHPENLFAGENKPLPRLNVNALRSPENATDLLPDRRALRPLGKDGAIYFMRKARGDKQLARKLAVDAGYDPSKRE